VDDVPTPDELPASPPAAAPVAGATGSARRRAARLLVSIFVFFSAVLLTPGIYLYIQSTTGTPAQASVDDCETTGTGRYESTHCSGTWIVGGSLLEGGHVIVGTIDGAEQTDQGKTIDVMLHGDTAYSRSLTTPLVLIAFGVAPALAAILIAWRILWRRSRPAEERWHLS
jgi:hypothetical protein